MESLHENPELKKKLFRNPGQSKEGKKLEIKGTQHLLSMGN